MYTLSIMKYKDEATYMVVCVRAHAPTAKESLELTNYHNFLVIHPPHQLKHMHPQAQ